MLSGRSLIVAVAALLSSLPLQANPCVDCHRTVTPGIVSDWNLSKHSRQKVDCAACHGDKHKTAADARNAELPTPATCARCHAERVRQHSAGKHGKAWAAMEAMPTIHWQPMTMTEGLKGCGGCHKIGMKGLSEGQSAATTKVAFGGASCDSCHTRHTFAIEEARSPETCRSCHMGFDHAQWEMYSSSRHGIRHDLVKSGVLPASAAAPTCQTCHMPEGNHEVRTAWGFLGVRLPLPDDKEAAANRTTLLQALGLFDTEGKPTPRFEAAKSVDIARLTQADWQAERDKMKAVCRACHASSFVVLELAKGDRIIQEADQQVAAAIRIVADLYKDGYLVKPKSYSSAFPDLLTFHDAPTPIEQRLFVMFMEHRMRAFQGAFHNSPDYALWYGWSELRRDLVEIKEMARVIRGTPKPGDGAREK